MSIPMNSNRQHQKPTVGLLLIVGEIISSEQRDEICMCLQNAFQQIDGTKYYEINDLFNNLIHENEFQIGLFVIISLDLTCFSINRFSISTNC